MKNKVVSIVCVVLIIAAIICFGYIFINSKSKDKPADDVKQEETIDKDSTDVIEREERGKNINVNSRIGIQLKELIKYSDIYSNDIINELDNGGLTSKAKLLIGLDRIYRKSEYQSYLEYSEEYNNSYILPTNMNAVLSGVFQDPTVSSKEVDGILNYDTSTNVYVVVSRGFQTGSIGYTLEVPYKITEYSDRVGLDAYRVYVTKTIEMNETQSITKTEMFYDKAKSKSALTIDENNFDYTEEKQLDYIKDKVDTGVLNENSLEKVKYTFISNEGEYRIQSFKKIK